MSHYFIGIKIPDNLAHTISEARNETNLHVTHKTLPFKEDLHITLYFMGGTESEKLEDIIQTLHRIDWKSFKLTTNGLAHFGNNKTPRVVYVALEDSDPLHTLHKQVVAGLSNHIEITNVKDFKAHITIAKKWASKGVPDLEGFVLEKTTIEIHEFSLFKINPQAVPRYEVVATFQSRGG